MDKQLANKVALVTGAGGGIGFAVAQAWLAQGARCVLLDMIEPSMEVSKLLEAYGGNAQFEQADVTSSARVSAVIDACTASHGRLDVLFNNAALFDMAPLLECDEAMYEKLFSVNVKAMFFTMQAAAKHMVDRGNGGKIINMASQAGRRGEGLAAHYCASKAAVISYTQSAAHALAPHGINVNAIAPGVVDTPMWDTVDALFAKYEGLPVGEKKRLVGDAVPLGRMGTPSDITGAAVFLASEASDYITGQTLNVDGGNVMS